MQGEYKIEDLD